MFYFRRCLRGLNTISRPLTTANFERDSKPCDIFIFTTANGDHLTALRNNGPMYLALWWDRRGRSLAPIHRRPLPRSWTVMVTTEKFEQLIELYRPKLRRPDVGGQSTILYSGMAIIDSARDNVHLTSPRTAQRSCHKGLSHPRQFPPSTTNTSTFRDTNQFDWVPSR